MRFVLALLTFRHLISRTGIIHLSEVVKESGVAPTIGIIDELLDAGVMGQRDDDIIVYPSLRDMLTVWRAGGHKEVIDGHKNTGLQLD